MPKEKIVVGMATYGRGWTLTDKSVNGTHAAGTAARVTKFVGEAGVGAYYEVEQPSFHPPATRIIRSLFLLSFARCWPRALRGTGTPNIKFRT